MAQSNLNISIDEDVKRQSEALFADLGMNMSTAINVFLRQAIRKRGIPFEIVMPDDGLPKEFDRSRLRRAIADIKNGNGKPHELIEGNAMETRQDIDYFLSLPYKIEIRPSSEGGFGVSVPDLPGCISQGETVEEAMAMIADAKAAWLEIALEDGMDIPEPKP